MYAIFLLVIIFALSAIDVQLKEHAKTHFKCIRMSFPWYVFTRLLECCLGLLTFLMSEKSEEIGR